MLGRPATYAMVLLAFAACGTLLGLDGDDPGPVAPSGSTDAEPPDGSTNLESGSGSTPTYNDIGDRKRWQFVRLSNVGVDSKPRGGAFDGRYLYLSPRGDGSAPSASIVRYDTTAALNASASWSTFDVRSIAPDAGAFRSAAFDGRFAYFASVQRGAWARVDPTQPFKNAPSWTLFDPSVVASDLFAVHGMVFDGRYVYAVPFNGKLEDGGAPAVPGVARFDTTGPFASAQSWTVHRLPVGSEVFHGGVFDGRFVWLVPHYGGKIVRYDTLAPFDDQASWQELSVAPLLGTRGLNGRRRGVEPGPRAHAPMRYEGRARHLLVRRLRPHEGARRRHRLRRRNLRRALRLVRPALAPRVGSRARRPWARRPLRHARRSRRPCVVVGLRNRDAR